MYYLRGEFDLCTGCGACQLACSNRATGGYSPRLARLKVFTEKENLVNRPLVCTQCENPFCMNSCFFDAISQVQDTGLVLVDKEKCTGCGNCVAACPDGMIKLDNNKKADKCDMCEGLPEPLCVKYCIPKALKLVQKKETGEVAAK